MVSVNAEQLAALPDYLRKRGLVRQTIFTPANTLKMALLASGFLGLHYMYLSKLVRVWWTEPDWSHGFIIPLFSLYFLASNYQKLLKVEVKTAYMGVVVMLLGLVAETTAFFLTFDYGVYLGMICMLFGVVLWLGGWQVIRIVWLPILFLVFAVNIPEMIYRNVAYEFQQFAARASVVVLQLLGVQADMAGELGQAETVITLWDPAGNMHQLNVEEACSGMRLLMAFGALAVAVSYLSDRDAWQRAVLIVFALPIAVLCNLLRVVITGLLYYIGQPEYAQGIFHTFTGLLMLIPAGLIYLGLAKLMDLLVVEEYAPAEQSAGVDSAAATTVRQVGQDCSIADNPKTTVTSIADRDGKAGSAPVKASLWRQLRTDKHFVACFLIVLVATGGLRAAVTVTKIIIVKQPLPLRATLASLPDTLGSFQALEVEDPQSKKMVKDRVLPEDMRHALGTDIYLDRNYMDTAPEEGQTPMVSLFTTYYTGKPVLVPHVPERCQAAAGYTQTGSETFEVQVPGLGLPNDKLTVRASIFSGTDQSNPGRTRSFAIIYFFVANGKYFNDWKLVRLHFRLPKEYFFERYSYYAFLRLTFPYSSNKEQCIATAQKFIKAALPEMIRIWPDWKAVSQSN